MQYNTGSHCVFYHRYHLVWSTKDRFKVLKGRVRLPVRDICRQVCHENEVDILRGVFSQYAATAGLQEQRLTCRRRTKTLMPQRLETD